MAFLTLLQTEFERRRTANRRYSLRSFARSLSIDHSALSQILRGRRRLTARNIRALGPKLGMDVAALDAHCADEHESAVLDAIGRPGFRPDSRWIATMSGLPIDEVNIALQRLLYKRVVIMQSRRTWTRRQPRNRPLSGQS